MGGASLLLTCRAVINLFHFIHLYQITPQGFNLDTELIIQGGTR
jgi:hypothetical protein